MVFLGIAFTMFCLFLVILLALIVRHRAIDAERKDEERKRKFVIWYLDKQVRAAKKARQEREHKKKIESLGRR